MIDPSVMPSADSGNQSRLLWRWFRHFALLLVAAGAMLLVAGALMPAYNDPVAAERIFSGDECAPGIPNRDENLKCDSELWHRSMSGLRTSKWRLVDGGGGLLLSGLMLAVFFWWNAGKRRNHFLTPKKSLWILALASLCWWMQIPAYHLFFLTEAARNYYPHWADSIAIPIFAIQHVVREFFLPYIAIWLVFLVGARLSARLVSTVRGRLLVNAFWTGAAALLLVPIGSYLIIAILDGPMLMVPFLWLTVWLVFSVRAAALTPPRPGSAPQARELTPSC